MSQAILPGTGSTSSAKPIQTGILTSKLFGYIPPLSVFAQPRLINVRGSFLWISIRASEGMFHKYSNFGDIALNIQLVHLGITPYSMTPESVCVLLNRVRLAISRRFELIRPREISRYHSSPTCHHSIREYRLFRQRRNRLDFLDLLRFFLATPG